jgi:hypothetical protein
VDGNREDLGLLSVRDCGEDSSEKLARGCTGVDSEDQQERRGEWGKKMAKGR